MSTWQEFVTALIRSASDEAIAQWGEDIPTTVLFGKLGKGIADHIEEIGPEAMANIFQVIENGMRSNDADLKEFVATGLLEALYLHAFGDHGLWGRVETYLGPLSGTYIAEWAKHC